MAYRLESERVTLNLPDDLSIEVVRIEAWPVAHTAARLANAYYAAKPGDPELVALREAYEFFVLEAQPVWDIEDHRGRIPPTASGMLRLRVPLALQMLADWIDTLVRKPTAVDELIPEGPLRDELNAGLRKAARKRKVA